jgi:branched-subunit amino acid transport protein
MSMEVWLAIVACALGTFALRLVPLIWLQYLAAKNEKADTEKMPPWLTLLGPVMIAAMFGVSLVPVRQDGIGASATIVGVLVTYMVWYRSRSLGKPVFWGVVAFGVITYLLER